MAGSKVVRVLSSLPKGRACPTYLFGASTSLIAVARPHVEVEAATARQRIGGHGQDAPSAVVAAPPEQRRLLHVVR